MLLFDNCVYEDGQEETQIAFWRDYGNDEESGKYMYGY